MAKRQRSPQKGIHQVTDDQVEAVFSAIKLLARSGNPVALALVGRLASVSDKVKQREFLVGMYAGCYEFMLTVNMALKATQGGSK